MKQEFQELIARFEKVRAPIFFKMLGAAFVTGVGLYKTLDYATKYTYLEGAQDILRIANNDIPDENSEDT